MSAIQKLKALRNSRKVTVREVELESRKIAAAKGNARFYISNARLTQLENDPLSEPSLWKLLSLSAIYHVGIFELMRFYNVDVQQTDRYNAIANPDKTQLLPQMPETWRTTETLNGLIRNPEETTLLPRSASAGDIEQAVPTADIENKHISNGYIGLCDFTMYPLIRPASFVTIDTRENKLRLMARHNEYERPIYFVELRDGYICGWCELRGTELLVIPHHISPASIRCFRYPQEAEIVGQVIRFSTHCLDDDQN